MSLLTAIVTPFKKDGSINMESFTKLIFHQIENKVDGIVIFGTTGEAPTLELEEKFSLLDKLNEILVDYPDYKEKIIIGFSGNSTSKVIREMEMFSKYTFNNYMLSAPYYNKPSQEGLFQHYNLIMNKFQDKNFLIYNIPSRTGVNILPETLKKIVFFNKNYIGVKEASGNMEQIKEIIDMGVPTYSGDDKIASQVIKMGGVGVVSVASNLFPKEVKEGLYKPTASLSEFFDLIFIETNPCPIKYLMKLYKIISNEDVRLPLVEVSKKSKIIINDKMVNLIKKLQS